MSDFVQIVKTLREMGGCDWAGVYRCCPLFGARTASLQGLGLEAQIKDSEQQVVHPFLLGLASLCWLCNGPVSFAFQGYELHVTPNVKPEPEHMRDIIKCSGGTFLPRMPRAYKVCGRVVYIAGPLRRAH